MKKAIAIMLMLAPLLPLLLMYIEGGMFGVFLYFGYALGAYVIFILPKVGYGMIQGTL